MKKSIISLVIVVLVCALLAPASAFAVTEPTLPLPHKSPDPRLNISADSSAADAPASSSTEEALSHEVPTTKKPSIHVNSRVIDADGNIVENLDTISETADSTAQIYTVVYEFYALDGCFTDASISIRRPTTSTDCTLWRGSCWQYVGWSFQVEGRSVSVGYDEWSMKNHYQKEGLGWSNNIFIRTIPNTTYLSTPEHPDGVLLSDSDLANEEQGAKIGFSTPGDKIPGGRENLCTITFQFAVSTKEASLAKLTENTISAVAEGDDENKTDNLSSPASPTASSASGSGATNALILHAVVDVLMIIGASLILLYAMNFYKQEILAEILTLRDQLLWSQKITKNADLPVADGQLGYDGLTPDDLDELGTCFYAWLRTYD